MIKPFPTAGSTNYIAAALAPSEAGDPIGRSLRGSAGTVGWVLPSNSLHVDKSSEFDRDWFAFVAGFCISGKPIPNQMDALCR